MKINYILDTRNNQLKICSKEIVVHTLSSYDSKILQVLANNEWNQFFEMYRYTHKRSRFMLFIAFATLGDLGFEIEITACSCRMSNKVWIT